MKWLFELSSEIPTILRTLGWLDFDSVMKQLSDNSRELDELTGISLKRPRSLSNPKGCCYNAWLKVDIEKLIPA
jgi:hypothetical protein